MARRNYSHTRGGIRSGYNAMRTYNTIKRVQRHGLRGLLIRLINMWIGRAVWHASSPMYLKYGKRGKR